MLCMPPMSDLPSDFINTGPGGGGSADHSRRLLPNPVSEVSMIVHALAAAGQTQSESSYATMDRMMSSSQAPYSEYVDISVASATPWRPIQGWSTEAAHTSSSPSYYDNPHSNSPDHAGTPQQRLSRPSQLARLRVSLKLHDSLLYCFCSVGPGFENRCVVFVFL